MSSAATSAIGAADADICLGTPLSVTMPCEPLDCVPVASSCPQSPEPSSALSGTRTTGTPPLEYWTSTVPPLPTAYWVHVRMLRGAKVFRNWARG